MATCVRDQLSPSGRPKQSERWVGESRACCQHRECSRCVYRCYLHTVIVSQVFIKRGKISIFLIVWMPNLNYLCSYGRLFIIHLQLSSVRNRRNCDLLIKILKQKSSEQRCFQWKKSNNLAWMLLFLLNQLYDAAALYLLDFCHYQY